MKIQDLDESFLNACHILRDITDDQISCIEAFIDSQELVRWIRSSAAGKGKIAMIYVVNNMIYLAGIFHNSVNVNIFSAFYICTFT